MSPTANRFPSPTDMPHSDLPPGWTLIDEPAASNSDLPPGWSLLEEPPKKGYLTDKLSRTAKGAVEGVGDVVSGAGAIQPALATLVNNAADTALEKMGMTAAQRDTVARLANNLSPQARLAAIASKAMQSTGSDVRGLAEYYQPDPARDEEFSSKLASAAGSMAPIIASGPAAPLAAGAMMGEQGRRDAESAGASQTQQAAATMLNAPVGVASEALLGLPALLRSSAVQKGVSAAARTALQAVKQAGREGAQEAIEQATQNVLAKDVVGYAPDRDRLAGVGESALIGGVLGGGMGAAYHGAAEIDARSARAVGTATPPKIDTGANVAESAATLQAQQTELIEGRRTAMMFPAGSKELPLPEGFERLANERGIFHFDPDQISAERIRAASAAGRENEILGLGKYSKGDVDAHAAATGEPEVSVVERAADGTERKAAVSTPSLAPEVAQEMAQQAGPGASVKVEPVAQTLLERLKARDAETSAAQAAQDATETQRRAAAQKAAEDKRATFDETMAIAEGVYRNPQRSFAEVQGVLERVAHYAQDNSLGLSLEQRQRAAKAEAWFIKQRELMLPQEEARRAEAARAREEQAAAEDKVRKEKLAASKTEFSKQVQAGIGPDGSLAYDRLSDTQLADRAQQGDVRAEKELTRRAEAPDDGREKLLSAIREIRLPLPQTSKILQGELQTLVFEEMNGGQRKRYTSARAQNLDRVAEALRGRGFSSIHTPDDVVNAVSRALRGEDIRADTEGGEQQVRFAAAKRAAVESEVDPASLEKVVPIVSSPGLSLEQSIGKTILNEDTREEILVPRTTAKKFARNAATATDARIVANTPELLRSMRLVSVEPDNLERPNIKAIMRFVGAVQLDDGVYPVRATVWQMNKAGAILHHIEAVPEKRRSVGTMDVESVGKPAPLNTERQVTVRDLLDPVKLPDGTWRAQFARGPEGRLPQLSPAEASREMDLIRKAYPELTRQYDLEVGFVEEQLRKIGYSGEVPEEVQAAVARLSAERNLIVLSVRAYSSRGKAAGLLTHELAHNFWDIQPQGTRAALRALHALEVRTKSGPLYRDGVLQSDLDFVEDLDENGHREWFAERVARLNEGWALERLQTAEKPLLLRVAYALRTYVRRLWEGIASRRGVDIDSALFVDEFRAFWRDGARGQWEPGRASAAWASRADSVDFATRRSSSPEELAKAQSSFETAHDEFDSAVWRVEHLDRQIEALQHSQEPDAEAKGAELRARRDAAKRDVLALYDKVTAARADLDALTPSKPKSAAEIIAEAPRATPLDDRQQLMREREDGLALAKRGETEGNQAMVAEGFRRAREAADMLDKNFPGWRQSPGAGKDTNRAVPGDSSTRLNTDSSPYWRVFENRAEIEAMPLKQLEQRTHDVAAQHDRAKSEVERYWLRESYRDLRDEIVRRENNGQDVPPWRARKTVERIEQSYPLKRDDLPTWPAEAIGEAYGERDYEGESDRNLSKTLTELRLREDSRMFWRVAREELYRRYPKLWEGKTSPEKGHGDSTGPDSESYRDLKLRLLDELWDKYAPVRKARYGERLAASSNPGTEPLTEPGEPSPFAPGDEPMPVRPGRAATVYGQSAVTPTFWQKGWANIREAVLGWKGALPELPAFPDLFPDKFVKRFGRNFYAPLEEFHRSVRGSNDYIQFTAAEQLGRIVKPLLDAKDAEGKRIDADSYARLTRLQESARKLKAEQKPVPPPLGKEIGDLQPQLERHPYVLFERFVEMLDFSWRNANLKDSQGNPIKLPGGLNKAEIDAELSRLGAAIEQHPQQALIERAVADHMDMVKRISDDLKARGLMAPDVLANPYYFPHLTLEITRGDKTVQRELRIERVRPGTDADFRSYLIDPVGSEKAIESDYSRAMYYHLVQVGAHNLRADLLGQLVRPYDIRAKVEERAKELAKARGVPVSWEQAFHEEFAPDGYVLYGSDSQDAFPQVTVDRDKLAQRLGIVLTSTDLQSQLKELGVAGVKLLPEDLRETLQMGSREIWIVPGPVADALRGMVRRANKQDALLEAASRDAMGKWKFWKLFAPQNHIRYEYGNIIADVEKMISTDPGMAKQLPRASKEIRAFFSGAAPSEQLRAALKNGVINSVTAQEVGQLPFVHGFEALQTTGEKIRTKATNLISAPWAGGKYSSVQLSAIREATTRFAKFLSDLEAIEHGSRPNYAGAYWKDVEGITNTPGQTDAAVKKAAKISRDTFGDYNNLTVSGEYIRSKIAPFYSWMEINFKYHANLFRNLRDMVSAKEISKAEAARSFAPSAAGFSAMVAGGILLRLSLPYVGAYIWNHTEDRDELEDTLSAEDKRRFHVILGKDDQGRTRVVYGNTAFMDVLKWVSGPAFAQLAGEWMAGKTDFGTFLAAWRDQLWPDFANNVGQSIGPYAKLAGAVTTRKNFFPDVTDPKTIPAYDFRRFIISQITDDFTADMIERTVNKDYLAPKDLGDWARQLVLQQRLRDPESWAYYSIRDKADEWLERKTGNAGSGEWKSKDQQVLRNFRRSIYRGDVENAVRMYRRLLDYGYTAERFAGSIRAQDPLNELSRAQRAEFVHTLEPFDRETLLPRAYAFYSKMADFRGQTKALFPSEKIPKDYRVLFPSREERLRADMERMKAQSRLMDADLELRRSLRR